MMTLTRARGASGGFYLSTHRRRLDQIEMLEFQGIPPHYFAKTNLSRCVLNAAIGNAMSCNVLERLIPKAVYATGMLKRPIADRWSIDGFVRNGAKLHQQQKIVPPLPACGQTIVSSAYSRCAAACCCGRGRSGACHTHERRAVACAFSAGASALRVCGCEGGVSV